MPKKLLALLLSIIALFALIDLAHHAKMQLAHAFGNRAAVSIANVAEPSPAASRTAKPAGLAKAGIVAATWDGSATR